MRTQVPSRTSKMEMEQAILIVMDASSRNSNQDCFTVDFDTTNLNMLSKLSHALGLIGYDAELTGRAGQLIARRKARFAQF